MGCGTAKEKIENEMMMLKLERTNVQMERKVNMKMLKEIDGIPPSGIKIPDYIDENFARQRGLNEFQYMKDGEEADNYDSRTRPTSLNMRASKNLKKQSKEKDSKKSKPKSKSKKNEKDKKCNKKKKV